MPNNGNSNARAPKKGGFKPAGAPHRAAGAEQNRKPRHSSDDRARRTSAWEPRDDRRPSSSAAPREMGNGRQDRGRDWTPPADRDARGGAPRRSFGDRDSRPARDDRAPRFDRDDRAPRRDFGDRDSRPARDDRGPRRDFGDRDSRPVRDDRGPRRDFGDRDSRPVRDDRAPRFDRDDRAPRRDFGDRDSRPARDDRAPRFERDDRAPRRDFGDRPQRDRFFEGSDRPRRDFGADRNGQRSDRVERDRSRDRAFDGARSGNPNKKAFFEDVVLERLEAVEASEAITVDSFADMNLHPKILVALTGMGAETPFPIQASTIPAATEGRDVLGRGKTGSGKTIAFTVPLVTKLVAGGSQPRKPGKPRALILAPTRELADQIDRTVNGIARPVGFYTTCIYGGVPQRRQENAMSRGVDIVVATPGRLEDLMAQGIVDLSEVETVVVDEADHMCDLGFIEPVRRILRAAGDCQKLLFSATLDREVDSLVKEFLPNPYVYEVPNEEEDHSNIEHRVLMVDTDDRSQVLLRLVQGEGKSLIFTRTKMTAERLSESLTQAGVPAARLHGDLNQNQRNRNLERFTKGAVRVLVATDVAARGIHVDDVQLVVQVDPPEEYKTYLHRCGRTGRAGKDGVVVTLVPRSRRRRMEDLLRRAERPGIFDEVRPSSPLLEQLAGPIAPPPAPEVLDFGDSRGGRSGGSRGGDRDRGPRAGGDRDRGYRGGNKGNFGGNGKGRWADKPNSEPRPRARKFQGE